MPGDGFAIASGMDIVLALAVDKISTVRGSGWVGQSTTRSLSLAVLAQSVAVSAHKSHSRHSRIRAGRHLISLHVNPLEKRETNALALGKLESVYARCDIAVSRGKRYRS